MKLQGIIISAVVLVNSISAFAQEYFQQKVDTKIEVSLDDKNHVLKATEEIVYTNNSQDELAFIIMHVWPNAYKNNRTDLAEQLDGNGEIDFHFADSIDRGFIDQLDFKVNGESVKWTEYNDMQDVLKITLNQSLKPGGQITISTPFRVKIPKGIFSRLGHIGESYQITQWFPKPAVYDREGWHPLPYLSQGEFYSEYGSYDVKITLPANYVVGATGDLVNGATEIEFLENIVASTEAKIKAEFTGREDDGTIDMSFPKSSEKLKTLHFHQENVHDFAWFADKRYNVLKGEVKLPNSDRKVTTWAMFTNNEFDLWTKSIEYLNDATFYYSKWVGEYPYNHVTAVDGSISAGGGMEYPNVTVIGESYTDRALEQVIVHEVGHNWFYGLLGSNERYNAWMDEGLNTFTENRYTETKYAGEKLDLGIPSSLLRRVGLNDMGPRSMYDIGYLMNARRNYDQPIQIRADKFTSMNYGAIIYGKTAIGFDLLLAHLGDDLFDKCMHAYFDAWNLKHPQPSDIRSIFETTSGKDLSWLFDDFIKTYEKIDYGISGVKVDGTTTSVKVSNTGKIAAPYSVSIIKDDEVVETKWNDGHQGSQTMTFGAEGDQVVIDYNKDIPEYSRKNNFHKTSGILKKVEPLEMVFLGKYEKEDRTSIYWAPTMGWNAQDRIMLGAGFYNTTFPEKQFEWLVNPMYAFGSKSLVGQGDVKYTAFGYGAIRKTTFGYNFKSFNGDATEDIYFYNGQLNTEPISETYNKPWNRHELRINTELKNKGLRRAKQEINLRGLLINEQLNFSTIDQTLAGHLQYRIVNKQVLKPASLSVDVIGLESKENGMFVGASLTGKIRKNYNLDLDGVELRLFGCLLYTSPSPRDA